MTKRMNKRNGTSRKQAGVGGDIPPAAIRTYRTASCVLPKVTERCVVRAQETGTLTASAAGNVTAQYNWQVGNAHIGVGFWDQYKIDAVRITIAAQNNAIGLVTNTTTTLVPLYCVIDYDDSTALGSTGAAMAYSNCIALNPGESLERTFKPRMAVAAYAGAFTSYANLPDQWIDAASPNVQHYGVKVFIPAVTVAQTLLQSWDVTLEYFVSFRKSI